MFTAAQMVAGETDHPASSLFISPMRFQWHRLSGGMLRDAEMIGEFWDRVDTAAAKPYPEACDELLNMAKDPSLTARLKGMKPPYSLFAVISSIATVRSDACSLGMLRAARLAVGCQLHKLKFGAHPQKLTDLTASFPKLFKKIPTDPFSGKPMLYRKTKTGFVVYSVGGWDRSDNGAPNPYGSAYEPDLVFIVDSAKFKAYQAKQRQILKRRKLRRSTPPAAPPPTPAAPSPGRTAP